MRSFVAVLLAALMVALSFVPTYDIFFHYSVDENCSRCGRLNYGTVKGRCIYTAMTMGDMYMKR